MATVRRLLTEILLSVTNSEISAIVRECMEEEETSKEMMTSHDVIIISVFIDRVQVQDPCTTKESAEAD